MEYVKEFSEEEYQILVRQAIFIDYYKEATYGIVILIENINRLKELIHQIWVIDQTRINLHPPVVNDQIESSLNTNFFNVLSSFYHFIGYIEVCFKKWFGKSSQEVDFIVLKKSEYFDNYFEYRFFYKLRNYVTHCGIPIIFLFDSRNKEGFVFTQTWYFSQDLLYKYNEWGKVKKDLESQDTIMIFQSIFSFDEMITKFLAEIKIFLLQRFAQPAKIINDILEGVENIDQYKQICIYSYEGEGDDTMWSRLEKDKETSYTEMTITTYILQLILKSQDANLNI